MKKTKLLTSLAALALVLGLGACTTTEDETPSDSGTDTTTEEMETTPDNDSNTKDTTVENYTLSFTFTLQEQPATLEDYESLYIAGDFNEWALEELTENEGAYEFTIPSITVGEHSYKVLLAYTGSPDWDNEIIPANEDNTDATFTVADGDTGYTLEWELTKAFGEYLEKVTTRTDFVVNYFFVDDAANPTTYYSVPTYADSYVAGYFTSDTGNWQEPNFATGLYKLVGEGGESGYSVTFPTILTGSREYNIYFEFNSSATGHSAATALTWNYNVGKAYMTIPTVGDSLDVYVEANPATIIIDIVGGCSITLAIKNTGTYSGTLKYKGTQDNWASEYTLSTSSGDYDYYITLSVDQYTNLEFGIYQSGSNWSDTLQAPTNSYGIYNSGNDIVIPGSLINTNELLVIFTADCSGFGSSTTHVTATNVTVS